MSSKSNKQEAINLTQADLWDDTLLIKRYDESLRLAREEVAKRIAQSTNSAGAEPDTSESSDASEKQNEIKPKQFTVGDYVRCTFSEDGIDYEALIISVDGEQCTVKYIGYENEEETDLADLIPSWGKKERRAQIAKALSAKGVDDVPTPKAHTSIKASKRNHTRKSTFEQYGTAMLIPPPPPMPNIMDEMSEDTEHLSAMLMSWYMSGYYTGLYQGQRQAAARAAAKK